MQMDEIYGLATQLGLTNYVDTILQYTLPAAAMRLIPCDEVDVPVGGSKVGGAADLPRDMRWPEHDGHPLSLLAQIRCEDIEAILGECSPLPQTGLLLIFFDMVKVPGGMWLDDFPARPTIHVPTGTPVKRVSAPVVERPRDKVQWDWLDGVPTSLRCCSVDWKRVITLPTPELLQMYPTLPSELSHKYIEYYSLWEDRACGVPKSHVGGHPYSVQSGLQQEACANWDLCRELGETLRPHQAIKQRKAGRGTNFQDWRLLLQLDSHPDETGINWGDGGVLHVWGYHPSREEADVHRALTFWESC
jgi:uncharacterized protein YwqG